MSTIYQKPDWLGTALTSSPFYRAPVSLPGVPVDVVRATAAFDARGADVDSEGLGFSQWDKLGATDFPTRNLCGATIFRRRETSKAIFDTSPADSEFGIPIYSLGTSIDGWNRWVTEYDYLLVDEADEDYVDGEGVHHPRWKPVIQQKKIVDIEPDPFVGHPGGGFVHSIAEKSYPWYERNDEGETGAKKDGGKTNLTKPYDAAYYEAKFFEWRDLPASARRRTNSGTFYGSEFSTSHTDEGEASYLCAGSWYSALDLTADLGDEEDADFRKGWAGTYRLHVPHVHRQNAPVVYDSKRGTTDQIHNERITEAFLSEEITERKWMDERGHYDTSPVEAFTGVGWMPHYGLGLAEDLATYGADYGGVSRCRIFSADGATYRVTVQLRGRLPVEEGEDPPDFSADVLDTKVLTVSPVSIGEFDVIVGADELLDEVRFHLIEQFTGGTWVEIPVVEGIVRDSPHRGGRLLAAIVTREGERWGFHEYQAGGGWPDSEEMPYGIQRSKDVRYFRKQTFRAQLRATPTSP